MDYCRFQIFIFLIVIFSACTDTGPALDSATVEFNGKKKEFSPFCIDDDSKLYISFSCDRCDSSLDLDLGFSNIQKKIYKIDTLIDYSYPHPDTEYTSLYSLMGGDVVVKGYNLLNIESNFFEITKWDENNGEITGHFQLTYYSEPSDPNQTYYTGADTVHLKCDSFHIHITK